jgi:hypothetical protein
VTIFIALKPLFIFHSEPIMTLFLPVCRRCSLALLSFALCAQAHAFGFVNFPPPPPPKQATTAATTPTPAPKTKAAIIPPPAEKTVPATDKAADKAAAKTAASKVGCEENGRRKSS